jgi:hypothetical protein
VGGGRFAYAGSAFTKWMSYKLRMEPELATELWRVGGIDAGRFATSSISFVLSRPSKARSAENV